jgi:epoxyqueuosine reductase
MRAALKRVEELVRGRVTGLDEIAVLPVPDTGSEVRSGDESGLAAAASRACSALDEGLIPDSYGWTRKKTARAYRLKGYADWAACVIVAAKYYFTDEEFPRDPAFGRIARYTWRNNYRYITIRLRQAVEALEGALGRPVRAKVLSNYTSIPEKVLYRMGGTADLGKHGVLLHPAMGSLFTVGEAFCDLSVGGGDVAPPLSPPRFDLCGECGRCRRACPTGAIVRDGVVDVTRCFQYMTETLLVVPVEHRERWGSRVYGCSECLDACPFNERLEPVGEKHGVGHVGPGFDLLALLELGENEWTRRFHGNQVGIRDRRAILKNVILSLGWLAFRKAAAPLASFLAHEHPVIRASAAWALGRISTPAARGALERRARTERNALVIGEIERFL